MSPQVQKYLHDVLRSIALIQEYLQDISDYDTLFRDTMRLQAVERNFGIIGVALNQAFQLDESLSISHIQSSIGLSHQLVHKYMNIDYRALWAIYKHDLPILRAELDQLI